MCRAPLRPEPGVHQAVGSAVTPCRFLKALAPYLTHMRGVTFGSRRPPKCFPARGQTCKRGPACTTQAPSPVTESAPTEPKNLTDIPLAPKFRKTSELGCRLARSQTLLVARDVND